ncbi:hypothetical protein OG216_36045 [Streptomycetaceae bacterium NBC_01309]
MAWFSRKSREPEVPFIDDDYLVDLLDTADFPRTEENLTAVIERVGCMFLVKACQFIDQFGTPQELADFQETYGAPGEDLQAWPQEVLEGLVAWNPQVAEYIVDLPTRVYDMLLEGVDDDSSFLGGDRRKPLQRMHDHWTMRDGQE